MSPHYSSHPLDLADIQELVEEAMTGDKGNTLTVEYKVSIVSHTGGLMAAGWIQTFKTNVDIIGGVGQVLPFNPCQF